MKKKAYVILSLPIVLAMALYFQKDPTPPTQEQLTVELQRKMDKELFVDALELIDGYKGEVSVEWLLQKAKAYEGLRQSDEAIAVYESVIEQFPQDKRAYTRLLSWYKGDYPKKYLATLSRYQEAFPNEDVVELREYRLGFERTFIPADEIFDEKNGFSVFKKGNRYGIMDSHLDVYAEAEFDRLSNCSQDTGFFAAQKNGVGFYVDENGYKRSVSDVVYEVVGFQSDNRAFAKRDGKYGFIDYHMNELTPFIYEDATSFYNGVAAVKHEGKWRLINRNFEKLSDALYDDIRMDGDKVINAFGVIWAKQNQKWQLLNEKGDLVSNESFLNVQRFVSNEPTAVQFKDGWGFIDLNGQIINAKRYQDARAFMNQKALVKINATQWVVMSEKFEFGKVLDARSVSPIHKSGIIRVEDTDGSHYFIKLNDIKND
ncbi:WG repeat-containing protein [Carnobacteriaceae bacterium zg-ZUI252]|nr:WG repeat-containing protein [Carnobacteriaceae bacterium zg-ZUI252]MBS4769617.1 WG repeat-containing protein [Carnobacteriaceae bacterium zg-ZUI240]